MYKSLNTDAQQFKAVSVRKKKKKSRKHEGDEEGQDGKLVMSDPEDHMTKEKPSDVSYSEENILHLESNHSSTRNSSGHSSFSGDVDESIQQSMVALSQPESSDAEGDATSQAQLAYQTTEMVIKATNEGMNHTGGHSIRLSSEMRTNVSSCVRMCACIVYRHMHTYNIIHTTHIHATHTHTEHTQVLD